MKNDAVVQVRMPRFKQLAWRAAAQKAKRDLSEWVREQCDRAAGLEESPFNAAIAVERVYRQRIELPTGAKGTTRRKKATPPASSKASKVRSAKQGKLRSSGHGPRGGDSDRLPAKR